MADEDIAGGLSVEITADDARLEAGLREALVQIEAWRQQANRAAVVRPTVQTQGPIATGAAQAVQAEEQVAQRATRARRQARQSAARQEIVEEERQVVQRVQRVARTEAQAEEQVAQGRGARRKNIRTRSIGTEVNPALIHTFEPEEDVQAQGEVRRGRERDSILSARNRAEQVSARREDQAALRQITEVEAARRAGQLQLLSRDAERDAAEATAAGRGTSATFAPQRTPAQQRRFVENEERRAAAIQARPPRPAAAPAATPPPAAPTPIDPIERERRRALADLESRGTGRGRGRGGSPAPGDRGSDEEIARRQELRVAQAEANRLSAARTARTFASGLGGFSPLGTARQQIEANAAVAASEERVRVARRRLADPEIIRSPRAYRAATEELTVALGDQEKALGRVRSLTTGLTAARSLAAVTIAGAAFGAGLQAISTGFELAQKAASPYIDSLTGYAAKTAALTDALSDQARQIQGNSRGVVELRLAQTGLASSAAASIQPFIQQRVQIEAGNKALGEQIESFKIAENLRKAPGSAGLGSTTGGFLGTPLFGIPSTGELTGNFLQKLQSSIPSLNPQELTMAQRRAAEAQVSADRGGGLQFGGGAGDVAGVLGEQRAAAAAAFDRGLEQINGQLVKGGASATQFVRAASSADARIEQTAQAFDTLSPEMAKAIRMAGLYSEAISGSTDQVAAAVAALSAINLAGTITGPAEQLAQERIRQEQSRNSIQALQAQQEFNRPAIIAAAQRQAIFARETQLPAQQALQNLANPPTPVGTGLAPANAAEQERITQNLERANELQDELNARYEDGRRILTETYKIPAPLLDRIGEVGQQIASIQAGIANRQAQYQVAQYNFQLSIARRSLQDINGLTGRNFGGVGSSYLGQLEAENLALSRQGQILQFNLSQRQINFQRAVAGFTAPGLTPEERAARIEQANIEADYAQKQLDIGRNIFENQVQIVDIQNLRQGEDLARQIGLLLEGRQITIDTAAAQQELERLAKIQEQLVAEAGTYIQQVDSLVSAAMGEITQLETAAGRAMQGVASETLEAFGIFLNGMSEQWNDLVNPDNALGGQSGGRSPDERDEARRPRVVGATGLVGRTVGATHMTIGEAGAEEVAILRNPRAWNGGGGGGGTSVTITLTGDISVRSDDDLRELERRVEGVVVRMLGRGSSIQGLRAS